jgi:hypothetical protein
MIEFNNFELENKLSYTCLMSRVFDFDLKYDNVIKEESE